MGVAHPHPWSFSRESVPYLPGCSLYHLLVRYFVRERIYQPPLPSQPLCIANREETISHLELQSREKNLLPSISFGKKISFQPQYNWSFDRNFNKGRQPAVKMHAESRSKGNHH